VIADTTKATSRSDAGRQVDLSVIAPCYNEEGNVVPLVSRLLAVFERRKIAGEIVLVNDCSTDGTGRILDQLAVAHPEVRVVHHRQNRGLAAGWHSGLDAAVGTYACFIDADLQNPPEEVWRLYREITQSRADLVQGVRSAIGRLRDGRYLTSRVLNLILNLTFGMSATDNKSGFVVALRQTMTDVLRRRFRYRHSHVFIAVAAHARGYTFREVETLFQSRHAGESFIKHWPIRLVAEVCWDTLKALVEFRLMARSIEGMERFLRVSRRAAGAQGDVEPNRRPTSVGSRVGGQRITRRVRRMYEALIRTQWEPPSEIRQLQELRLRRMIRHAYHHVPYYSELFDRLRIRPDEIQTLDDLRRLPLLSQEDVRENLYFDLFSDNHRKRDMQKVIVNGSNGEPLEFYVDVMQLDMGLAGHLRAGSQRRLPFAVTVGDGETRRELSWIACDCDSPRSHHVAAESYIVEIIRDGRAAQSGEDGEVVITDLNSFSVPLIRYQTGEHGTAMDTTPCGCGRGLPTIGHVRAAVESEVPATLQADDPDRIHRRSTAERYVSGRTEDVSAR
jgi:phenylacetate-CoA ligase